MDFRDYLAKAEADIASHKEVLDKAIKEAKEAELSFLEKKESLKKEAGEIAAQRKELDAKIKRLAKLEKIQKDEMAMAEKEAELEQMKKKAQKMMDDAATMKLQAEQALQSAHDVKEKAQKEAAATEAKILEKFKKIMLED